MSELWRFVYIESHVTLHAKADAQKVNCNLAMRKKNADSSTFFTFLISSRNELTTEIGREGLMSVEVNIALRYHNPALKICIPNR